jgi:hypothetical protein
MKRITSQPTGTFITFNSAYFKLHQHRNNKHLRKLRDHLRQRQNDRQEVIHSVLKIHKTDHITTTPKESRSSQRNLTPVQKAAVRSQFNSKQTRTSSSFQIRNILDRFLQSRTSQQSLVEKNILFNEIHPEDPIPLRKDIVQACITYIENRALNEEGVYRISGHATEVRKLCSSFRGGKTWLFFHSQNFLRIRFVKNRRSPCRCRCYENVL